MPRLSTLLGVTGRGAFASQCPLIGILYPDNYIHYIQIYEAIPDVPIVVEATSYRRERGRRTIIYSIYLKQGIYTLTSKDRLSLQTNRGINEMTRQRHQ